MLNIDGHLINPLDANSYWVLDNMRRGLDPNENKNTKVTLELLQKMDYKDLETKDDENNFKPSDVVSVKPTESESDDGSVFNYLFPEGLEKKEKSSTKSKKALIGKNDLSEKLYNMKKD